MSFSVFDNALVLGRVRVAVRLRPRNQEELVEDADFADCVELQPEVCIIVIFIHQNTYCQWLYTRSNLHTHFGFFFLCQLKRLRLRKNNWDFDTYEFDEVLTEFASQKRVYEVVAKPVVEVTDHTYYK